MNSYRCYSSVRLNSSKIDELRQKGLNCFDMHLHTRYSPDSSIAVKSLLKKASKKGIGFAVTDHNEIKGCLEAMKNARNATIIPGIEVCCNNHLEFLFYFYSRSELVDFYKNEVVPYKTKKFFFKTRIVPSEILDAAKDYSCIAAAPHPYFRANNSGIAIQLEKGLSKHSLLNNITAIEVLNSLYRKKKNLKSINFALSFNKAMIAGSDSHSLSTVGTSVVASKEDSVEGVLNSIKRKQNLVMGRSLATVSKLKPGFNIFKTMVLHPIRKIREKRNT